MQRQNPKMIDELKSVLCDAWNRLACATIHGWSESLKKSHRQKQRSYKTIADKFSTGLQRVSRVESQACRSAVSTFVLSRAAVERPETTTAKLIQ
jgi:hypothetical protein